MKSPFLRSVSDVLRKKYYAKRTEETYLTWIISFIRFHKMRHPKELWHRDIAAYLEHLALQKNVAMAIPKLIISHTYHTASSL